MTIHNKMDDAWHYSWDKLFSEKTHLFYDYITSHDPRQRLEHLPLVEEIKSQFPNPAGWGTGMEDSMLNAGSVMEVLCLRHELLNDPDAPGLAQKVLDGMSLCARVHGNQGFLVRSVSPRDGRSCYFNSSRDQFTLAVYGAWRYCRTFNTDITQAVDLLTDIAAYCEKTVTDAANDDLRRLDGKPALVSTMIDVQAHEVMRLPMFYAAAWDITQDSHWFDLYRRFALPAIEINLNLDPDRPWWDIELSQMQLSLALLAEVEPESALKEKYHHAMTLTAQLSCKCLRDILQQAHEFTGNWDALNTVWRTMDMRVRGEILTTPYHSALFGSYPCVLPQFPDAYHIPYAILRALGNHVFTILLSRDFSVPADLIDSFIEIAARPDYTRHASDAPINILHGYWTARKRNLLR